jgi:serine/threonine protein kinase
MELKVGSRIRDYEIVQLITGGGMGEVFLAREHLLGRTVVLKKLGSHLTHQEGFAARFQNEARIQAQLAHPNIVGLLSFFDQDNEYFMVLEYAPGITLRLLMDQIGPIPEQRAINIFRQITLALAHAHSKGIVHRDIKPSNIMVDIQNNDAVKVMDFGVALLMNASHLTRTGSTVGTIYYMSPEQVNAVRDIDQRSDIYSTGVLLYEMLSGRLPYDVSTDSDFRIQYSIVWDEMPDPRTLYPFISESTVNMLRIMTIKDRNKRPGSFDRVLVPEDSSSSPAARILTPQDRKPIPVRNSSNKALLWIIMAFLVLGLGITMAILLTGKKQEEPAVWDPAEPVLAEEPAGMEDPSQPTLQQSIPASGMVYVQGGSFTMGSANEADEQPPHRVRISPFRMAVNEVTQADWRRVMGSNPSKKKQDSLPVSNVSWQDAIDYCNALSRMEGLQPCYSGYGDDTMWDRNANGYRLPTEAEWEFAAGGGVNQSGYRYSGSDDISSVGWHGANSGKRSHPVRSLAPNALGLYDMTGNVWEWCWDWYDAGAYYAAASSDPVYDSFTGNRVVRGGCWVDYTHKSTITRRSNLAPSQKGGYIGFRVCRNA